MMSKLFRAFHTYMQFLLKILDEFLYKKNKKKIRLIWERSLVGDSLNMGTIPRRDAGRDRRDEISYSHYRERDRDDRSRQY